MLRAMTLLLIGATREAQDLARRLGQAGRSVLRRQSPSGRDPDMADEELSDEVRIGNLLAAGRVRAVLDMGHPFEAELSARLWRVARERGLDHLRWMRAPWAPGEADRWTAVRDEAAAGAAIPDGAVVFVATGRESLTGLAPLAARATLWCRVLSAPETAWPFATGGWLPGTPPFSVEAEMATLRDIGADWMVARNAGGQGNLSKFVAAARLGLPVAMIDQPAPPEGMAVTRDMARAEAFADRWA